MANNFRSAYSFGERQAPRKGVFSRSITKFREDFRGGPHLVKDGIDPLFDLIQAAAPGQMIYNIIDRYASLSDLMDQLPNDGVYGDLERMPADLRAAYEYLHGLRARFDDVARDRFDGTFGDFLQAVEDNTIFDILSGSSEKVDNDVAEEVVK